MSVMLFIERVYMAIVILYVKLLGKKIYTKYNLEKMKEDLEINKSHPKVLVQIPMFNEKEVYKISIGAACRLSWPSDRVIVQVLDDSTNLVLKELVEFECLKWIEMGVNVKYETRNNRNDFQPDEDFLWRTLPYLLENPKLGLAQARWKFVLTSEEKFEVVSSTAICVGLLTCFPYNGFSLVNADECLMTRLQEMSLDYHFSVEQEVGSSTCSFFGFNGTAGVWQIQTIEDAGGWKDRTTVEDMDLAVRASLKGWKFIFVGDLGVKNELPSTFKAYRYQQHRWSFGPSNLFRKMTKEIILCERVTIWKRLHLIYEFFIVRKIIAHWVTFFFYCIVIPASVLVPEIQLTKPIAIYIPVPEIQLTKPIAIYIPATITLLNAVCTPRSFHLIVFWILFENVMSLLRTKAAIIGLLEANRVNEWVDPCIGADDGDLHAILRNLQHAIWKQSLLRVSDTASRGIFHNGVWIYGDICT
ncbi:hypothetical protein JRO89_XS12G0024200 [Xanthoceras sorbifolium]|uniref:Glycosyltransferase 2-like domain-containing protein n=1 Tax=Xanthoceras sorbifolium TaxID=99658 RepID=A0ABQ8HAN6_9ROSI|nr:hypothetical protein JRO89_XS12G0024200 [Xanthoceras sorbifolium]